MHAIGENRLFARGQQLGTFFRSEAKSQGQFVNSITNSGFAVRRGQENRKHQRLIARDSHIIQR